MHAARFALVSILVLAGCSDTHTSCPDCPDDAGEPRLDAGGGPVDAGSERDAGPRVDGAISCLAHAPTEHRTSVAACDHERPPGSSPEPGGPPSSCTTDADCTEGENGRCNGNGHDGWRCTYDGCFVDGDCDDGSICECEGAFRSDANTCVPSDCATDADCETGFCSPTLGSCGDYTGWTGWYCHTCEDECVTDDDCVVPGVDAGYFGRPYCAFDPALGHWACAGSHCAG